MSDTDQFSIIQSKGTLDWVYPSLILASTAAAMDKEVQVFHTFYGLKAILKDTSDLKVSPVGNPAMKIHLPYGPEFLRSMDLNRYLPSFIWSMPGMTALATWGFKKQMLLQGQVPVEELRSLCIELGVRMSACQMSVDAMNFTEQDFIDEVEFLGAASYFAQTPDSQSLFI
jgi:peroxiredoxin family protein